MRNIERLALAAGVLVSTVAPVDVPETLLRPCSVRQPRSTNFNVDDLVASMGDSSIGQLQPIWVRTRMLDVPDPEIGDRVYEIIFGERRRLAAQKLGWKTLRAEIHDELSDLDVFAIQNAENDARRNLTPFEQADAVATLMAPKEAEGFGITDAAEIAARLKISTTVVYQRIALSQASRKVRDAFYAGRLHLGSAIAICSLHDPEVQDQAADECIAAEGNEPIAVRTVQRIVQDRHHLKLVNATFDTKDAKLVDGVPACGACPKRAGSSVTLSLFSVGDAVAAPSEDERCTDRRCFLSKRKAHAAKAAQNARLKGLSVIEGQDAAVMFPAGRFVQAKATGLIALDERPAGGDGKTYRELLGERVPVKAIAVDADDRVHELADKEAVRAALAGKVAAPAMPGAAAPQLPEKQPKNSKGTAPVPEKDDAFLMQRKAEDAGGHDVLAEVVKLQERRKMTPQWLRFVLRGVIALGSERKDLMQTIVERRELRTKEHKGKKDVEVLLEAVAEFDEDQSAGLLSEIVTAMDGLHPGDNDEHSLAIAARFYKIDLDELVATRLRELKAEAKKRAKIGKSEAEAKVDEPSPARKPRATKADAKGGTCTACGCTDQRPCDDGAGDACVWADSEATLCSVCADIQGRAREILEEGIKSPTIDEMANMIRDRLDEAHPATRAKIQAIIKDAIERKQIAWDETTGRLRHIGARIAKKAPTEGATPSMSVELEERVVKYLRAATNKQATRKELLAAFKLPASEVLRAVAKLTADKLVKSGGGTEPVVLIAPSPDEIIEQLEGLKLPELKARYSAAFGSSAPQLGAVEIRAQLVLRLSGESMQPLTAAPKRNG